MSRWLSALALVSLTAGPTAQAAQPVLQRGYDAGVSGANLTETTLNTSNVGPNTFGLVFTLPVDDSIFAQPLYVPNVAIQNQGTHNVVYVATMNDTLYAFDADVGGAPLWSVNFASLIGEIAVPIAEFVFDGNQNIVGNLGILSTPVIDPSTNVMYLIAGTLENGTIAYRLHAVDITSGAEPYGPGVLITGSYGASTFSARYQTQRASLTMSGDQIVFGFGPVEQEFADGYAGWVMAYNKLTLQQSGVFATEAIGNGGAGIWQSGRPPVVDSSGYVYAFAGNAYGDGYDGVNNFCESALKLDPGNGLSLVDWFTAGNWSELDAQDMDISSSGPLLIPGTSLLTGGGKLGVLYVLNTADLGKFNASDSQIVQEFQISTSEIHGGPVYWQRSAANGGPLLYDWGAGDTVKAYAFNGTVFATNPSSQGSGQQIWPGGILTLSANGQQSGSGVLWATVAMSGDAQDNPPAPGELHAFNAENLSQELWNSTMNSSRDGYGNFGKFVPPLVANGKVYVATWSNQVAVYGLLSSYTLSPASLAFGNQTTNLASAPMLVTVKNTGVVALSISSITLSSPKPFSQTNTCGSSVAVGGSCTVSVVFNPSSAGAASATLSVNAGGSAGTQTVALNGTGVVPTYTVSPASLAFGSQMTNLASAPMLATVKNTGAVALPITSITLSSPKPFSQTNTCGSSVAVGGSCTVSVVFNPSSAGAASATLSVNAGGSAGTQTVALNGTGVVPTYTVSPASLAFGSQMTNLASAPMSVTVKNTGVVALPITSITLSSPQPFSQTNTCGSSVAVGGSCTVSVVFNPSSAGAASATLSVNAGGNTSTVNLSGSGSFTVSLTASSSSVTVGVPVTLNWSSTPGAACTASGGVNGDNWTGQLAASGSRAVSEASPGNYQYLLNCIAQGVSAGASVTVAVTLPAVTLPAVTLSATPSSVNVGLPVTLIWSSANAATCVASGGQSGDGWAGSKSLNGTATVTPTAAGTITYGMTCSSGPKSAQATAVVTATSSPPGSQSGGGALDPISLLSLLTMIGLRQRRVFGACRNRSSRASYGYSQRRL
jgi:hypothetical protein